MQIVLSFEITPESNHQTLFEFNGKLNFSPLETKAVVKRTASYKMIT